MRLRPNLVLLAVTVFSAIPAHADILIRCFGYNRALNDHVEWDLNITGHQADLKDGKKYSVVETKRYFMITGPASSIRINKSKESYVMWGPKGPKAPAIEWSRNTPGEGCEIPKRNVK